MQAFQADECFLRYAVLPNERVLFAALPKSVLALSAPCHASAKRRQVTCQRLYLHAGLQAAPAATAVVQHPLPWLR